MTSRILPREEWDKLKGTEAELVTLGTTSTVVVVEDDEGQVVGCHVLQAVLHAECLWVHPDHRKKAAVARRLWWSVRNVAQQLFNAEAVWTASLSKEVDGLLEHVGATAIPGTHYLVPLVKRT